MSAPIPEIEPREITQARTVKWSRSLPDYLPADGWQLAYTIKHGTTTYTLAWGTHVTASGAVFNVTLPATLITALTAGVNARLNGTVTLSGEVFEIYDGALRIKVVGELSHARTALAAVEAMMAGNASREEKEYSVSGGGINKSVGLCDKSELIKLREYYRREVQNEEAAERAAQGLGSRRIIRNRYMQPR